MERTHGPIFACSKARMNRFVHGLIRRLKHGAGGHWLMVQGLSYPKVCNERKRAGVIWYGFHAENRSTRQGTGCGGRGCSPDTVCAFSNGGRRKSHDVGCAEHGEPQQDQMVRLDCIQRKRPFATASNRRFFSANTNNRFENVALRRHDCFRINHKPWAHRKISNNSR